MEMDKTFQQLMTHVIDLCHVASNSSCEKVFTEFEKKYTTLKGLFFGSREKPLREHEKGMKSDILSCEIPCSYFLFSQSPCSFVKTW